MAKAPSPKRCFLITPIGGPGSAERKRADWVFRFVEEVCEDLKFKAERADTMPGSPMITSRIFGAVTEADIAIADLSDLNANVFYELGVRHSFRRPVIHIAEIGTSLPFDNAQHDTIFYDLSDVSSIDQLKRLLEASIKSMTIDDYVVSNPLTAALGALELGRSGDPKDQLISQLSERIERLERSARPPRRRTPTPPSDIDRGRAISLIEGWSSPPEEIEGEWSLSEDYVRGAVSAVDMRDMDVVNRFYDSLYEDNPPSNKDYIKAVLYEYFPDLRSRIPASFGS